MRPTKPFHGNHAAASANVRAREQAERERRSAAREHPVIWRPEKPPCASGTSVIPEAQKNTGSRNAPMPKPCNIRSETNAPTNPIQLRAAREPVSTEALLNEGSSGEYEASARKSRSAETQTRNPISSLSRRLFVGAKICEKYFIGRARHRSRKQTSRRRRNSARARQLCQELAAPQ